jgi:DNA-binding FrmR family transcriptional regulator
MSHDSPHPDAERRALQLRLRRVAGQLKGIEAMLDRECGCAEILNQLVSARRALKSLSEKIIQQHLHHSIRQAAREDSGRRALRELVEVLERYIE